MNQRKRQNFEKKVWEHYRIRRPAMPWRRTKNPYHIFVSEVMLQQTQIPRVKEKYPEFLHRFPDIQSLASAPLRAVLAVWSGMGYNRRALYLQKAAQEIVKKHTNLVPKNISALDALPGIGPYSARAIACFAYGICEPFIETNIRRVIIHEFFPHKNEVRDEEILHVLGEIEPAKKKREWYWALMDYGREALKGLPNANRKSRHHVKQSKFEGSPRYIRANIILYLLEHKKATLEELHMSLKKDRFLADVLEEDVSRILAGLEKEKLIKTSKVFFRVA